MQNRAVATHASRAERIALFSQKERLYISNALRELWSATPVRHTVVREKIDALINEFDPFDE
jgi:hypothetical protein